MNKYPLERFKRLVNDADNVYSMVLLNETMLIRADINKDDLLKGLDQLKNNCFFLC